MESILDWNTKEGMIFRGGSGSGINLSNIRGSVEPLQKGGTASRAGQLHARRRRLGGDDQVGRQDAAGGEDGLLDMDHPDIEDFIRWKADEEKKAEALRAAGFDRSIDGDGFTTIQYQNANNSVRVTDEFMEAVEAGEDWDLTARTTGETTKTLPARD